MRAIMRIVLRGTGVLGLATLVAACSAVLAFTSPEPGLAEPPPRTAIPPTPDPLTIWPYTAATPEPAPPRSAKTVASLLEAPPAPGRLVEVDAYYSGTGLVPYQRGPQPSRRQVDCPQSWEAALTDRPFQGLLNILNGTHSNILPDDEPWLIAASAEGVWPGKEAVATLPYHARLRGYLGDPAFSHCSNAGRIFVVMEVVEVYQEEPPEALPYALPEDFATWPRYQMPDGYSLACPPGWKVESLDRATLAIRSPLRPEWPILVRVHAGELPEGPYEPGQLPTLLQGDSWSTFKQGTGFDEAVPGARLNGYLVDRYTEPSEREVSVLFPGQGRTYELTLRYPLGFDAMQPLLTAYSAVVEGFRVD